MFPWREHSQLGTILMRLHGINLIEEFSKRHPDSAGPLSAWKSEVESANWKKPLDIKQKYPKASIISGTRAVFNIKGNEYRLDLQVAFGVGVAQIMRIGTHAEYDKWKF